MHPDIIWLNGASSSGKTTLAKELQRLLDDQFMHVCFDAFYQMLPAQFKPLTADGRSAIRQSLWMAGSRRAGVVQPSALIFGPSFGSDLGCDQRPKNRLQTARWSPIYTAREIRCLRC